MLSMIFSKESLVIGLFSEGLRWARLTQGKVEKEIHLLNSLLQFIAGK